MRVTDLLSSPWHSKNLLMLLFPANFSEIKSLASKAYPCTRWKLMWSKRYVTGTLLWPVICSLTPCCLATLWMALVGVSSSTTWLPKLRRMSYGSCLGRSVLCRVSKSLETCKPISARDSVLSRWQTTTKLLSQSNLSTATLSGTVYSRSPSRPTRAKPHKYNKFVIFLLFRLSKLVINRAVSRLETSLYWSHLIVSSAVVGSVAFFISLRVSYFWLIGLAKFWL